LRQRAQQVHGDLGMAGQPGPQVVVAQPGQPAFGHRDGAGRTRPRIEQRQLAEHLAGAEHAEQVLAAVRGRTGQLDLAVQHDVQPVTRLTLAEQGLPAGQAYLGDVGPQCLGPLVIEGLEERGLAQNVHVAVGHASSSNTYMHSVTYVPPRM
jgi:hypothetical protein